MNDWLSDTYCTFILLPLFTYISEGRTNMVYLVPSLIELLDSFILDDKICVLSHGIEASYHCLESTFKKL